MTVTNQEELDGLKEIGRIVINTMQSMASAMEPGGAVSAPQAMVETHSSLQIDARSMHGLAKPRKELGRSRRQPNQL
ncbi:hypothetical protein [Paracoccus alkanivorans]|uniref:hypothetical protein n=1 Tax=Paracoccus alkanivorans TaxID=2116655 RepID=UPI003133328A